MVVFDGYLHGPSCEDLEHSRRERKASEVSPDVFFDENQIALFDQQTFLANEGNKNRFIVMLISKLAQQCIQSNGDAEC